MQGLYGTRSTAALIVTSSEEVSFFEAYLEEGIWKEHAIDFHIEKLKLAKRACKVARNEVISFQETK